MVSYSDTDRPKGSAKTGYGCTYLDRARSRLYSFGG
jgi:hypothetical protein